MRNTFISLVMLIQVTSATAYGQDKEMFIEQIAEKRIIRENFDQNGNLLGKQIFLTGELMQEDKTYRISVITELYDKNSKLTEKYTTNYQCNPNEFNVLLNVFPFTDPDDEKVNVDVTSEDFKQLYDLQSGGELKDIHLKMSVESGVLSFFGSKSIVTMKDRNSKTKNEEINISSQAIVEAYIMGLKIKTINYSVEEYLTINFVLKRQKFTEEDGSYFTMEYDEKY